MECIARRFALLDAIDATVRCMRVIIFSDMTDILYIIVILTELKLQHILNTIQFFPLIKLLSDYV